MSDEQMGTELWWNFVERGKLKNPDKNPHQTHLIRQKSHIELSGFETMPPM